MAAPTTFLVPLEKRLIDEEVVGVQWDGGFCNVSRYNAKEPLNNFVNENFTKQKKTNVFRQIMARFW